MRRSRIEDRESDRDRRLRICDTEEMAIHGYKNLDPHYINRKVQEYWLDQVPPMTREDYIRANKWLDEQPKCKEMKTYKDGQKRQCCRVARKKGYCLQHYHSYFTEKGGYNV